MLYLLLFVLFLLLFYLFSAFTIYPPRPKFPKGSASCTSLFHIRIKSTLLILLRSFIIFNFFYHSAIVYYVFSFLDFSLFYQIISSSSWLRCFIMLYRFWFRSFLFHFYFNLIHDNVCYDFQYSFLQLFHCSAGVLPPFIDIFDISFLQLHSF